MFRVLIGFNIKLAQGETWDEENGGKIIFRNTGEEVRFEAGEIAKALPQLADKHFLDELGAIEVVEEVMTKKPKRKAVDK